MQNGQKCATGNVKRIFNNLNFTRLHFVVAGIFLKPLLNTIMNDSMLHEHVKHSLYLKFLH